MPHSYHLHLLHSHRAYYIFTRMSRTGLAVAGAAAAASNMDFADEEDDDGGGDDDDKTNNNIHSSAIKTHTYLCSPEHNKF